MCLAIKVMDGHLELVVAETSEPIGCVDTLDVPWVADYWMKDFLTWIIEAIASDEDGHHEFRWLAG